MTPQNIYIETYGCQMNEADSALMAGLLCSVGCELVSDLEQADVVLLNTCAVREKAEERVWSRLRALSQLRRKHPSLLIGVCGCMAKHLRQQLLDGDDGADLVVGPDSYGRLPALIEAARSSPTLDVRLDRSEDYRKLDPLHSGSVSDYITVMRGCDQFCSFCIVPFVRGRERSLEVDVVMRRARDLARAGCRELILLGQTVNAYRDGPVDFTGLLGLLSTIPEIARLRFTAPHPSFLTPELVDLMACEPSICHHIHLPLQSGSNAVLERMHRPYTAEAYATLVEELRGAMPDLGLTTDVIVGFPGESEGDFEQTLDLVREIEFDSAFMFHYSERSGTHAARRYEDDVHRSVKLDRLRRLIDAQENISAARFRSMIGSEVEILIEGPSRRDPAEMAGRTGCYKTTVVRDAPRRPGDLIKAEVTSATSHTLIAEYRETL